MKLGDVFKRLSYGPLSNLAISNEGDGTIIAGKKPAIIQHLNDALLRLHSRFVLSEKEVIIEQREVTTNYLINVKNAVSNLDSDPANPAYVIDTEADPYKNDLIKVMGVYDSTTTQLPLNNDTNQRSVFTPQPNVLQVPEPIEGEPLYVIYQATHVPIAANAVDTVEINIPLVLEDALLAYIAYLVFDGMNGQDHTLKAQEYLNKYDTLCGEVIEQDLVSTSLSFTNTKFDDRGFV